MVVVCKESPKEYLQPFKDKLEEFFQKGRKLCQLHVHDTLRHPSFHTVLRGLLSHASWRAAGSPKIGISPSSHGAYILHVVVAL